MSHVAIVLTEANRDKILRTESIDPVLLDEWLDKKYGVNALRTRMGQTYYFVPDYSGIHEKPIAYGCVAIESEHFADFWQLDTPDMVNTDFVTFTRLK